MSEPRCDAMRDRVGGACADATARGCAVAVAPPGRAAASRSGAGRSLQPRQAGRAAAILAAVRELLLRGDR